GDRRRDVVVDRAHLRAEEPVHERALALLVLADDEDGDRWILQPAVGSIEPRCQIAAVRGERQRPRSFEDVPGSFPERCRRVQSRSPTACAPWSTASPVTFAAVSTVPVTASVAAFPRSAAPCAKLPLMASPTEEP